MVKEVSREEAKNAVFKMKRNKAPGPSGYTLEFFKASWSKVRENVCKAIWYCFIKLYMYQPLHSTIISLILKVDNPKAMKESDQFHSAM